MNLLTVPAISALRVPKVGDQIIYHYIDISPQNRDHLQRKITIIQAGEANDEAKISDSYIKNGKVVFESNINYKLSELANSDLLDSYILDCETKWNGKLVRMQTLAGSFEACKRKNSQGDLASFGKVPLFGILSEQSDEGHFEIESYHFVE